MSNVIMTNYLQKFLVMILVIEIASNKNSTGTFDFPKVTFICLVEYFMTFKYWDTVENSSMKNFCGALFPLMPYHLLSLLNG